MATGQAKIDIEWGLAEIKKKSRTYAIHRQYYDGIHRLTFATEDWKKSGFATLFSAFSDNLCPAVVNAVRHRLSVIGFVSAGSPDDPASAGVPVPVPAREGGESAARPPVRRKLLTRGRIGGDDDDADAAWEIWNSNRMDRRQKEIYREALIGGDVAVIVWNDPQDERRAVIHPQKPDKVAVRYSEDEPGRIEYAVKAWITTDKRARVTIYYADRIERWISPGKTQGGLPDKGDRFVEYVGTEAEPEDFEIENPIDRVPVAVYSYDAITGEAGRSRLHDVIPLQDALNKTVADMLIAGEFQAIPQRLVIGYAPEEFDEAGNPKPPWKPGSDRIFTIANEQAKAMQFEAANLEMFIKVEDSFRAEVARVSSTPLHRLLLTGQFPSGDALQVANEPLDAVVEDTEDSFGNSHEDLFDIALQFQRGRGNGAKLTTLWRDTAAKNAKQHAETVQIKRDLGISRRQGLREMGYSDPEIDEMDEEEQDEKLAGDSRGEEPTPAPVPGSSGLAAIEDRLARRVGSPVRELVPAE